MQYTWPDSFINNDISNLSDAELLCDALCAWGNCHAGASNQPATFGKTMGAIAHKLNILGTPDSFMAKAKEFQPIAPETDKNLPTAR